MNLQINPTALGFQIPTFGEMLTFIVKGFFVVAGIATLIMMLWGALAWVLSGGDKEQVEAARNRMVAALVGLFLILVALSTVWTLEQIVFKRTVCFGLSCPVSIPQLLIPRNGAGTNSNTSHIFAKPTATPSGASGVTNSQGTPGTSGTSGASGTGTAAGTGQGSNGQPPTPTGLHKLPGTGL